MAKWSLEPAARFEKSLLRVETLRSEAVALVWTGRPADAKQRPRSARSSGVQREQQRAHTLASLLATPRRLSTLRPSSLFVRALNSPSRSSELRRSSSIIDSSGCHPPVFQLETDIAAARYEKSIVWNVQTRMQQRLEHGEQEVAADAVDREAALGARTLPPT
jgi:hypothetical protein